MVEGVSNLEALVLVARHHEIALSADQIVRDNGLTSENISKELLVQCAQRAGLMAKVVRLSWNGLSELKKALPVIVELKNGSCFVLVGVAGGDVQPVAYLRDPGGDAVLTIDRKRFEDAWTGEIILVKREYELIDEEQPFSFRLVAAAIIKERRLARDMVLAALLLGLIALAPIVFWRLLSDKVIYFHAMNTFAVLCIAMAVIIVADTLLAYMRQILLLVLTARVDIKLSEYMFDKVLRLPIDFFERTQVGLIARDMSEIWRVRNFLTGQLFGTILDSLTLIFLLPVMFAYSATLTAIVLGICGLIIMWLLAMLPVYRTASRAVQEAEGLRGAFLIQNLQGIRTVKSLALENRQRRVWDVQITRIAKLKLREGFVGAVIQVVVRPLERLAVSGTYALGVYFALTSDDPVYIGMLFAYLMLAQRVTQPLMHLAQLVNQFDEARAGVGIIGALVNQRKEDGQASGAGVRAPLEGHVEFCDVTFKYPGASQPALSDVSFDAPIGFTLGVVGRSGSGKTTVTRLLQRLHSDYAGLIKIDGVDVREYDVSHLRRSLGVVLQENFLFSGTIRENIAIAKPNATHDEIVRAARLAGAEEFIERLPRGYETHIYEGSPNLSGGQRQRLAIARALILDPRILILDEATSALDPDSESIVNANIKRIARGRTVIVISHRLSSLVNSDAILVLERGQVLDIGRHQELLERCEIYSGLWSQQNGHVDAAPPVTLVPRSVAYGR
jgi:subfamily B ATP-binding cassette protein HlyB/CyaB